MSKARDIASAAPSPAGVTSTELGYVDGVTSAIQTQINTANTAINLLDGAQFAAGKNKILNADMGIWQRGTTFNSVGTSVAYAADRWRTYRDGSGATVNVSQQTFTPGTAPVAGYEGSFFLRYNQTVAGSGSTFSVLSQQIEDVRTFAGQTVTLSYWAKASGAISITPNVVQNFGSGGSGVVYTALSGQSVTTSWQRFTATVAVPSVTGKTINANSYLELNLYLPVNSAFTFDIWGVQLEAAQTASNFQTATGTKQGELAACQRYYYRITGADQYDTLSNLGTATSTTLALCQLPLKTTMRTSPTSVEYANVLLSPDNNSTTFAVTAVTLSVLTPDTVQMTFAVASGLTQFRPYYVHSSLANGYVGVSAEL